MAPTGRCKDLFGQKPQWKNGSLKLEWADGARVTDIIGW